MAVKYDLNPESEEYAGLNVRPNHWERKMEGIENYRYVAYAIFEDMWVGGNYIHYTVDYSMIWLEIRTPNLKTVKQRFWIVRDTLMEKSGIDDYQKVKLW